MIWVLFDHFPSSALAGKGRHSSQQYLHEMGLYSTHLLGTVPKIVSQITLHCAPIISASSTFLSCLSAINS